MIKIAAIVVALAGLLNLAANEQLLGYGLIAAGVFGFVADVALDIWNECKL